MFEREEIMTAKEAANFLKVSSITLRKIVKESGLPGHKMGKKWIFLRSEVLAWLKKQ